MRLQLYVDGVNYSAATLVDSLTVTQDSTEAISTATFEVIAIDGWGGVYDESFYDQAVYGFELLEYQTVELRDVDVQPTARLEFSGLIVALDKRADNQHLVWTLRCVDWGSVLDRTIINQSWPSGTTDAQIVRDVIGQLDPKWGIIADPIGVFVIANDLGEVTAKDTTARQVLEDVCELTGGEWHITYDRKARYYKPGSFVPAFNLSDHPDGVTTVGYAVERYTRDFTNAVNRVTILGALQTNGTELKTVMEYPASQALFGIISRTVIERQITNPVQLQLRALTEVNTYGMPRYVLSTEVYVPGAARGQTMHVTSALYSLDHDLIVRTVGVNVIAPDREKALAAGDGNAHHVARWHVTLGSREPDFIYALRRAQRKAQGPTAVPPAAIAPGSITPPSFAAGIEPIQAVAELPTLPNPNYTDTAVVFLTTDRKLYRRTGNSWTAYVDAEEIQGQITTPQLAPGSVISTVLADGAVVSAKIPTGAIVSDKIAAGAVEANAIAANAIGAEKIQANAITAGKLAANAVVAGNIAALAVQAGNIAADAVVAGTIAAAAINTRELAAGAVTTEKLNSIEIQVGYGASRCGKLTVWNAVGQMVAALGDIGALISGAPVETYFGIWAQRAAFGGTGYDNAPIKTDGANLTITDAALTITGTAQGAVLSTGPSVFDSTYNTLKIGIKKTGDSEASLVSRGLVLYDAASRKCGALVRSPSGNGGELTLYPASGSSFNILLDGMTGIARADGGFAVSSVYSVDSAGYVKSPALQVYRADGSRLLASLARVAADAAELVVYGPSGQSGAYILLSGNSGRVRADGGFQCQSYIGMNTAIQVRIGDGSTRTMTFVGGLLTSIGSP